MLQRDFFSKSSKCGLDHLCMMPSTYVFRLYCISNKQKTVSTIRWPNGGLMLVQRRRRWANIKPALVRRTLFAGTDPILSNTWWAGALGQWLAPLPFTIKFGVGFPVSAVWKKQKCFFPSTCETQYCGEPPWPRGSVLGLRPPGLEFWIMCLEDSVISSISPSSWSSGGSPDPV